MWYYYINIVFRVLNTNNYSKVWCDVLQHYIVDFYSGTYDVYDINGIRIGSSINGQVSSVWYHDRLESKYRYSGLLYDKLRCLFSYIYRNIEDYFDIPLKPTGTYVFSLVLRFNTRYMYHSYIKTYYKTFNELVINSLYFIDS